MLKPFVSRFAFCKRKPGFEPRYASLRAPWIGFALVVACAASCPGQGKTPSFQTRTPSPQAKTPVPPSASSTKPSYQGEAVVIEDAETAFHYNADGTGEKDSHMRIRVQSEAGARAFDVLSFSYASANESPQIESVVVYHPDETTTVTPASNAIDMPAPVTREAPLYSDVKQLQLPVRGLRPGDVLDYRVRIAIKNPEAPGEFWNGYLFQKSNVTLSETLTLDVPAAKYVQVWCPDRKPAITEKNGRRIYVWTASQLKPTSSQPKTEAFAPPVETKPDVAWTTFHSWAEVGAWYRSLAEPRLKPTAALKAQAELITAGAKSPLEQVEAIYGFVSTKVRYVGIDFGVGRYQPHLPSEVLANRYGDCKDKDTLLEALLRSAGFQTAPALIGPGLAMVPELPSLEFFNHVITTVTLNGEQIWLDSTPGVAPFQVLTALVRGNQALVIPATGNAVLERAPAKPPFPFVDNFDADATLDAKGDLSGTVKVSYRSSNGLYLRLLAQNWAPAQWDKGTQLLAAALGFSGDTSDSSFGRFDDTSQPMTMSYDYTKKPYGDWDTLQIAPMFPTIFLPAAPEKLPGTEIYLGEPRTENAVSRIQLPAGYGAKMPDAVHVKTPFATYDVTYTLEKGEFTAERKLRILESLVPAASWQQYKKFTKDISLGYYTWVQLSAPGNSNAEAEQLVRKAADFNRIEDWGDAEAQLDQAKKLNPKQPYLWSVYGYMAWRQGRIDDAKADFRQELSNHPDEPNIVGLYAELLVSQGKGGEAQTVLKTYFNRNATNQPIDLMLASLQSGTNLPDAIATLRRAIAAAPDNLNLQTALGSYLILNHQQNEAAALMKKVLDGAGDNAELLNDAAYELAETGTDLPLAEEKSRQSLDILGGKMADADIGEANAKTFLQTHMATASWDTLGFILFKENKLDEANGYEEAAWRNRPGVVVTLHYGKLLEARGDRKEAMRIYTIEKNAAHNFPPGSENEQALEEIESRVAALKAEHVRVPKLDAAAERQKERTFQLKLPASKDYWSATYRLQLDANGVHDAMQVSGMASRDGVVEAVKQLDLPRLVPPEFKGRIVRDAVISCSAGKTECEFVLTPLSANMSAERAAQ